MMNWKMPTGRNEPCAAYIGEQQMILLGGNPSWKSAHILNLEDGYWTQLPDAPDNIGSSGCSAGTFQGQFGVFVSGGFGNSLSSYFLNLSTKEWTQLPDMEVGGGQMTMANPGGNEGETLMVFGGDLHEQVQIFDGNGWKIMDVALEDGNTKGSASTVVTQQLADWLKTVEDVDWSDGNICSSGGSGEGKLRLANIYADHMVFQRAPSNPLVWGYGTPGS